MLSFSFIKLKKKRIFWEKLCRTIVARKVLLKNKRWK